ncbi:MAG: uracil DNA glycosylase [Wigglesworthia glossinidia]|nr:uracil DNA glycosylase [Wigglesworthia glossinidia]
MQITWQNLLKQEKNKKYFYDIFEYINIRRKLGINIYPEKKNIFKALQLTPINKIKVVILGQDPYHGFNQADGLCFSVKSGCKIPPSLKNIFIEIKNSVPNFIIPKNGCLEKWAFQGVLLLNSILTVEEGRPNSHAKIGWELFTNQVIKYINQFCKQIIFILWGNYAKKKVCLLILSII